MNIALAEKILKEVTALGVHEFCLCAGARNSPLVFLLEKAQGVRIYNFFEERSAAFFALGRIQQSGRPVAVITTSGTAVAELLPAAVEATYSQWPLLLITADRPRAYRGTGAPQTIEQVGILGTYVETCTDIAHESEELDFSRWSLQRPLQINVCFDEPLIDAEVPELKLVVSQVPERNTSFHAPQTRRTLQNPVVVVGAIPPQHKETVVDFLYSLQAPVYAEALSNLRGEERLQALLIGGGDKTLSKAIDEKWAQSVLRIGGVPTLRFWRDLEDRYKSLAVHSISDADYRGLARMSHHLIGYKNISVYQSEASLDLQKKIFTYDDELNNQTLDLLEKYPKSECALVHQLSQHLQGDKVYLGNSLPIREWDLVADIDQSFELTGNRGANGIDGQVSTFLGWSSVEKKNWAIIGDLTAMYDLPSLWVTQQLEPAARRIVVINNRGGQIFKNIFRKDIFLNAHEINFSSWAEMWKWDYQMWTEIPKTIDLPMSAIIELVPDAAESEQFWQEYKKL